VALVAGAAVVGGSDPRYVFWTFSKAIADPSDVACLSPNGYPGASWQRYAANVIRVDHGGAVPIDAMWEIAEGAPGIVATDGTALSACSGMTAG
jgi:hypothetical protein